jgi:hypothetical protein
MSWKRGKNGNNEVPFRLPNLRCSTVVWHYSVEMGEDAEETKLEHL